MLSYRHAFHAGNFADVLKHLVLIEILNYLNQKEKPYCYVDTHAGAGLYSLTEGYAVQNSEFENGISRLWNKTEMPAPVANYLKAVKSFQQSAPGSKLLRVYPGSPMIAARVMRDHDSLRLFEMHPTDFEKLKNNFSSVKRKHLIYQSDGFDGIKAVLPPVSRRGMILIDPSYEIKTDYRRVTAALKEAFKRFATGTYMVWFPILKRVEVSKLMQSFERAPFEHTLTVTFNVRRPPNDGFGMYGCGLFIGNPPYTLHDTLKETMPYLVAKLGEDPSAGYEMKRTGR